MDIKSTTLGIREEHAVLQLGVLVHAYVKISYK